MTIQVLSDDEKRSIYDRYGEAGLKGAGAGPGVSLFCEIQEPLTLTIFTPNIKFVYTFKSLHYDRISATPLIFSSHYLMAWVAWGEWAVWAWEVEAPGVEPKKVKTKSTT